MMNFQNVGTCRTGSLYRRLYRAGVVTRLLLQSPLSCSLILRSLRRYGASQKPLELWLLIRLLKGRSLKSVLEIGTRRGGTLYVWCRVAAPDAEIVAVDYHPKNVPTSLVARFQRFKRRGQRLNCLFADSHLPETRRDVAECLAARQLDFLFIDGDHTYAGVRQDFDMYSPFVRRAGLIAFHDIVDNPSRPAYGVPKLWRELRAAHESYQFIDDRDPVPGMGIGVLVKK